MAGTAEPALFFVLDDRLSDFGLRWRLGGAGGLLLGAETRFFRSSVFRLAVLFSAAALFFALLNLGAVLAATRFLQGSQARFLGLAQKLLLKLLAVGHFVLRRRLARLRSRRLGRRHRRWRL